MNLLNTTISSTCFFIPEKVWNEVRSGVLSEHRIR